MARIFITGSSDGIGKLAAKSLIQQGHQVVLHARNPKRAQDALQAVTGAEKVLIANLSRVEETKQLAAQVNALGRFDAVINNAGIYEGTPEEVLTVNTLAPYLLTCLIQKPRRLIYISSDMHLSPTDSPKKILTDIGHITYSDTKFYLTLFMKATAGKWQDRYINAVDPGWIPTKMGGPGATDDLTQGFETQIWLAVSNANEAKVNGRYFYHKKENRYNPLVDNLDFQEELLSVCEELTGVSFPTN